MDFLEDDEHRDLRAAVGAIAGSFGGSYYTQHAARAPPATSCGRRWATRASSASTSPRSTAAAAAASSSSPSCARRLAAPGCPLLLLLVSAAISAEVIARVRHRRSRSERWLPGLASGAHQGRLRGHRARRGVEHPPPRHDRHARDGDEWRAPRHQALHLRRRRGRRRSWWSPAPARDVATGRAGCRCSSSRPTRPACRGRPSGRRSSSRRSSSCCTSTTCACPPTRWWARRATGFRQVFHGLNPERITGAALGVGVARYALRQAAAYATDAEGVGAARSAPTRASPTRWPRRRSRPSWPR